MPDIQMVDLQSQYQKIKSEVDAAVEDIMTKATFINGPSVKRFSDNLANYLGVKHVIPCANGTEALQISLMSLNLKPGDEVIAPSFTYIASVEVIALLGLKVVFVDVDKDTFNIDPEAFRQAITPRTRAVIPVHLYGQCANMEKILPIAEQHDITVIEDDAQALGGHYTFSKGQTCKTGSMGHMGCTSFFPSKNLGAFGDGGAVFTNDDNLADKIRMTANHGQKERYYHNLIGLNSRLDSIQAAILDIKLKHLDEYCAARRKAADFYDNAFAQKDTITTPYRSDKVKHVFHQYTVKLSKGINRDIVKEELAKKGIPSMIYYPVPCHRQKMFTDLNMTPVELPVTDSLTPCVLSLPIHTEIDEKLLQYISENFLEIIQKNE